MRREDEIIKMKFIAIVVFVFYQKRHLMESSPKNMIV
jgi:hypothetical protein